MTVPAEMPPPVDAAAELPEAGTGDVPDAAPGNVSGDDPGAIPGVLSGELESSGSAVFCTEASAG